MGHSDKYMSRTKHALWTVNTVTVKDQLKRPPDNALERPHKSCKDPLGIGIYKESFPVTSLTVHSVRQLLYWIYFKEKQTANEVQVQEQPKVKEQGAKKKHGNEDLESKKKAPKKAKKEPTTQPCMPDLIKSTQQTKEVCKLKSLYI